METFIWRLQVLWHHIHGAKLWPLYTFGLVVGVPLLIIFRGKVIYVLGRALEISIYVYILHVILFVSVFVLNWLLEATSDPLMPTGGRAAPITMHFYKFTSKWYDPTGLMWCERILMAIIAFLVFKYRYTYKRGSGG